MKKIVLLALLSSFVMGDAMSGWSNDENKKAIEAQKAEQARMCELYTKKIEKYKQTMRDDDFAKATLSNYVRLQTKYCEATQIAS